MDKLKAVILAAGKGTRMNSDMPKVIHKCDNQPMVHYVIKAAKDAGAMDVCVIVGYGENEVKKAIYDVVDFVTQEEQLGTGHAVKCAKDFIGTDGDVLVLCGDTPLITGDTLTKLVELHKKLANGVTVLSAIVDDPTGYGRIIRDEQNGFVKIVEQKDADEEELAVKEINSGMYIFNAEALSASLELLSNDNAAGEYYLTDTIAIIKKIGLRVSAMALSGNAVDDIKGVNTIEQLEQATAIMQNRSGQN
ncbi:MAG: NTP transferase domain-containing protein [Lachnospiraceae bacterium]|nr:NTP transferase domain-containing protein [Lachnospiraceae bacterium]